MAAVTIRSDFGAQKIKSDAVSTVSLSISHEVLGQVAFTYCSAEKGTAPCGPPSEFIGSKMGERFLVAAH